MAIALVTGQLAHTSDSTSVTSRTVVLPNNPTAGNFVVLAVAVGSTTTVTASDGTNSYSHVTNSPFSVNTQQVAILTLINVPAGAGRTITVTTGLSEFADCWIAEFSGVVTSSPADATPVTASQPSGTTYTTPSITTVSNGDLVVTASGTNGGINGVSGSWIGMSTFPTTQGEGAAYQIQATAGALATGFTLSSAGTGAGIIAAFKPAAAGGPAVADAPSLLMMGVGI